MSVVAFTLNYGFLLTYAYLFISTRYGVEVIYIDINIYDFTYMFRRDLVEKITYKASFMRFNLIEDIRSGLSYTVIGKKYNISRQRVQQNSSEEWG